MSLCLLIQVVKCSSTSTNIESETPPPLILTSGTAVPRITDTSLTTVSCATSTISLNDLVDGRPINNYSISSSGQDLYLQSGDSWWEYSTVGQELTNISSISTVSTVTPEVIEQHCYAILDKNQNLLPSAMAISPNKTRLIFWSVTNPSINSASTPEFEFLSNVNYGAPQETDLFLLEKAQTAPAYLGKIPGGVKAAHWFPNEDRIVLEMLSFSPFYLWLVDIPSRSLIPLLSESDVSGAPKFALLDVSSDGNWVIYQTSLADHVFALDVNSRSIMPLYALPRTVGAWWLKDSERIIAVVGAGPGYYSVYKYTMTTGGITRLVSDLESEGVFTFLDASDSIAYLANIKTNQISNTYEVYVLSVCLND